MANIKTESELQPAEQTSGSEFGIENGVLKVYNGTATEVTIPSGVKVIGGNAFAYYGGLEKVTVPEGVTEISRCAFGYCHNLRTVNLPETLTSIEAEAFSGCDGLAEIVIPASVAKMGKRVFGKNDCPNLKIKCRATAAAPGWNRDWNESNRPVVWAYGSQPQKGQPEAPMRQPESDFNDGQQFEDGSFTFTAIKKLDLTFAVELSKSYKKRSAALPATLTVPQTFRGYPVTEIAESGFEGCSDLVNLVLPDSIRGFCTAAFRNCKCLNKVNLPQYLCHIPKFCFKDCPSLHQMDFSGEGMGMGLDIDVGAFEGSGLESVDLSYPGMSIAKEAFAKCKNLRYVVIDSQRLAQTDKTAFAGCKQLNRVYFCGTAAEWNPEYSKTHFHGADIYFYSQDKPSSGGRYWHWQQGKGGRTPAEW